MNQSTPATTPALAPYCVNPRESGNRLHSEPPFSDDAFAVDRRRILAATAFRRLQHKTQVFVDVEHDHFRSRLTHTLEVADIARRIAVALGANERLCEAIALAHDLGHPPFGHAGESALQHCMREHGGFEHNVHTLRVVDELEHPFPEFHGLNLTFEVREGIIKHQSTFDHPQAPDADLAVAPLIAAGPRATVEGQIASVADRLAYNCHDLEDALGADLIREADLAGVAAWADAAAPVRAKHPTLATPAVRRPILANLIDRLITDVVAESLRRLAAAPIDNVSAVRHAGRDMVAFSSSIEAILVQIEEFLRDRVYQCPIVVAADSDARSVVQDLFDVFLANSDRLPPRFASRVSNQGHHRVICDYVAGMTDRFCRAEHARHRQS